MKRWICLFLALSLALGLCACGGGAKPASPEPDDILFELKRGDYVGAWEDAERNRACGITEPFILAVATSMFIALAVNSPS